MSDDKKTVDDNHHADQLNKNKGTDGTNKPYDHIQGNRGKQLNLNRKKKK